MPTMKSFINILSLNVGLSSTLAGLSSIAAVNNVDLILLQEVRINKDQLNGMLGGYGYEVDVNIDAEAPFKPGTAIVWKKSLPINQVVTLVSCRCQILVLSNVAVVNIYAPSGSERRQERSTFFSYDVFHAISLFPQHSYVLGGDFNAILSPLDVEDGKGFSQKFCKSLKDLISGFQLVDAFRFKCPNKREYTFFRPGKAPSRLDKFFISRQLLENINVRHIASLSDHCAVLLKIKTAINYVPKCGRTTYWKLNSSILEEDDFLASFKILWTKILEHETSFNDPADWWDMVAKPEIKDFCIGYSKIKHMSRKNTTSFLLSYLKIVTEDKNWSEVLRVKEELHKICLKDLMGIVVRSRFQQNVEEEKGSLYHAAREMKNSQNNIHALKVNNVIVENKKKIEEIVTSFFHALFNGYHNTNLENTGKSFTPDYSNLDNYLSGLGSLSDSESNNMHADIKMEELDEILKTCKNNKSPGLDGLPYEFYRAVWPVIGNKMRDIFQCQLNRNVIVQSNKVGVTRLASKVKGIPEVGELRPITLLNSDYKILSKLLVKRVKPVLPSVILSSQLCTVNDKNILFGVNNILSSLFYVNNSRKKKACLLSLDFFKAYDRVVLDYLLKVMCKMNFSGKFGKWISMLHDGAQTRFILESLTEAIDVNFSIRQGDPIAMLLYILYIEPLLLYLERNLLGISISGINQKLEAFCDDVNVMTEHLDDIVKVDKIVEEFESFSGAILSRTKKCKIIGFGLWKDKNTWPLDYIKTEEEVKVFGIFIRNSYTSMLKRNWEFRYAKFNSCIQSWSSRYLSSLSSRVEILKVFALSRVYYLAAILPITRTYVRKFESVMGTFIWNRSGWLLRVSIEEIKNLPDKGGLSLVCIESMCSSLLLSQFLRLLKSSDGKTIAHIDYWIGDTLTDLVPSLDRSFHASNIPEYYCHLESLVVAGRIDDLITSVNWRALTNKRIYLEYARSFPVPKVQTELGPTFNFSLAWKRINSVVLPSSVRDVSYLLMHNKLPTKERLFRIALSNDPYCVFCPDAIICDTEHFFCNCVRIKHVWRSIRNMIMSMLNVSVSDWSLIHYFAPRNDYENETVWLIGNFIAKAWKELQGNNVAQLKDERFFGFLKYKFKEDQRGARTGLRDIPGLI